MTRKKAFNFKKYIGIRATFFLVNILFPSITYASLRDGLEEAFATNFLCILITQIQGKTGQALFAIAVIVLGIGTFFRKVNWQVSLVVLSGGLAIFGADDIINSFVVNSNLKCE